MGEMDLSMTSVWIDIGEISFKVTLLLLFIIKFSEVLYFTKRIS